MDDIVRQVFVKWLNVLYCIGWLLFDWCGVWWLCDDVVQVVGEFGLLIWYVVLNVFIGCNYECDVQGQWFFQNGLQCVYVEFVYMLWVVWFVECDGQFVFIDQMGVLFELDVVWFDDGGGVLFCDVGILLCIVVLYDYDFGLFVDYVDFDVKLFVLCWCDGCLLLFGSIVCVDVFVWFGYIFSLVCYVCDVVDSGN